MLLSDSKNRFLVSAATAGAISVLLLGCSSNGVTDGTVEPQEVAESAEVTEDVAADSGQVGDSDEFRSEFPCEGGAFPDDDEMRHLLCEIQFLWLGLFEVEIDEATTAQWMDRQAEATLLHATDPEAAKAELLSIISEMRTAGLS